MCDFPNNFSKRAQNCGISVNSHVMCNQKYFGDCLSMSWPDTHTDFLACIVAYTHQNTKKKNSHSKQLGQNNAHEQSCGQTTRISEVFNLGTFSSTIADAVKTFWDWNVSSLRSTCFVTHHFRNTEFAVDSGRLKRSHTRDSTETKTRASTWITETEFLTVSRTGLGTNKKTAKNWCTWRFFVSWA